jgi:CHAD domain-containing protein
MNESLDHDDQVLTGRDVVKHFLRRDVKEIARYESLVHEGLDAEGVHQLRVSARRLRSELRAMRRILPSQPWTDVEGDLKWLGSTLGEVRDLEVLRVLFEAHLDADTQLRTAVMTALEGRRERRQRDVVRALNSARYARMVKSLARLAKHPHLGAPGNTPAVELFMAPLWDAACRYFDAIGDPYERRNDEALHQVRIASKKCRYNFEVASLFLGDPASAVAESLEEIQDVLGQVHDRAVAVMFLDTLGFSEEVDLSVRRALRGEIGVLRPQWTAHFELARRGILEVFSAK